MGLKLPEVGDSSFPLTLAYPGKGSVELKGIHAAYPACLSGVLLRTSSNGRYVMSQKRCSCKMVQFGIHHWSLMKSDCWASALYPSGETQHSQEGQCMDKFLIRRVSTLS